MDSPAPSRSARSASIGDLTLNQIIEQRLGSGDSATGDMAAMLINNLQSVDEFDLRDVKTHSQDPHFANREFAERITSGSRMAAQNGAILGSFEFETELAESLSKIPGVYADTDLDQQNKGADVHYIERPSKALRELIERGEFGWRQSIPVMIDLEKNRERELPERLRKEALKKRISISCKSNSGHLSTDHFSFEQLHQHSHSRPVRRRGRGFQIVASEASGILSEMIHHIETDDHRILCSGVTPIGSEDRVDMKYEIFEIDSAELKSHLTELADMTAKGMSADEIEAESEWTVDMRAGSVSFELRDPNTPSYSSDAVKKLEIKISAANAEIKFNPLYTTKHVSCAHRPPISKRAGFVDDFKNIAKRKSREDLADAGLPTGSGKWSDWSPKRS